MKNIVEWDNKYSVGVPLIDKQHKELVSITNELFVACVDSSGSGLDSTFQSAVKRAVDYVRTHFKDEEGLQKQSAYPHFTEHKAEHEKFVKELLKFVKAYESGQKFVPNNFVRYLRDWLLEHIAINDRKFAQYYISNGYTKK